MTRIYPYVAALGLAILLAGCAVPGRDMLGVPGQDIEVQGSRFTVFVQGNRAEAIRRNFEYGVGHTGIMERGYIAIQAVSGCDIVPGSYDGDPARMVARLACPTG
ncbi:hypothetical protein [Actibacterium sp. XHP0104]|uniref:hypothetical protein n=1 Tax=Actibacterium sp. XHP0104 TaxID=2984335 RepID=UPI0021E82605|nr:hypothetical protein [Actibacterium sp. XHP0104]MCV2881632.1 hypothetical protein [Actibacterium sp. XHP0104]